jgi:hypothetical protein
MVLVLTGVAILILAASMRRTTTTAALNARNEEFTASVNAAEASTEMVIARMRRDYDQGSDAAIANNLEAYRQSVPTADHDAYWADYEFSDAQGNPACNYVQVISNRVYTPLESQFYGLNGWRTVYRVLSNARRVDSRYDGAIGAVQQDVEVDSIPVFQFAIFYNSLLEFTWAAPFTIRGRTHANASIYLGSAANLAFKDLVTATGIIRKMSWAGWNIRDMTGGITFAGSPGYTTNVPVLSLPIGTNNVASSVREIINMPPAGESVTSAMGSERYYNKAGMVLLVSNTTVTAVIKDSPSDPSPVVITSATNSSALNATFPFVSLTPRFTDQRENKTIVTTEIDMGAFAHWASTNAYTSPTSASTKHPSSNPMNILYVADNRSASSSELTAIRLVNGDTLPSNPGSAGSSTGLSVATPNPLYVFGNYNCPVAAYRNSTNTSTSVPASLVSDALTVLSPNWTDSKSSQNFKNRPAANTTINAAIVTGIVYSDPRDGSPFSGGVMNLPRLLEDWGNGARRLTMNTSIVNLFDSVRATAPFQNPGYYYYAPTRDFNFDPSFKDPTRLPPGTPMLGVILRAKWAQPPPNTTTYAGS